MKCDHGQAYVARNPSISTRILGSVWNQKVLRKGVQKPLSSVWVGGKFEGKKCRRKKGNIFLKKNVRKIMKKSRGKFWGKFIRLHGTLLPHIQLVLFSLMVHQVLPICLRTYHLRTTFNPSYHFQAHLPLFLAHLSRHVYPN